MNSIPTSSSRNFLALFCFCSSDSEIAKQIAELQKKANLLEYNVGVQFAQNHIARFNHDPLRTRKLLLHKYEIIKLLGKIQEKGYTLIPLNLYFKKGKVKVTVALVTGKKLYDKRQALAEKEAKRDIERRMKSRNY